MPLRRGTARPPSLIASWVLRVGTAAALAIDAAVHLRNATAYDAVKATFTQGQLFRVGAGLAVAAGLLVLLWPCRGSWVAALLVAGSALGAVLLYRYVDVGQLGPLPNMYENTWQVPGKLLAAYAEGAAVVLAGLGLWAATGRPGQSRSARRPGQGGRRDHHRRHQRRAATRLQLGADATARVMDVPAGTRPLRAHVDPSRDGSEVVSVVADRIRVEFFRRVGLDNLLTTDSSL